MSDSVVAGVVAEFAAEFATEVAAEDAAKVAAEVAAQTPAEVVTPTEQPICLITSDGTPASAHLAAGFETPSADILLSLYRRMVVGRRFDVQVTALTRQGRLATYPSAVGQEACEIGAVAALTEQDWLFPTYRDTMAVMTRGVAPADALRQFRGDWHTGFDPYEHRISALATPLATQALHAVGLATAAKLRGDRVVALTFLGDGSTSEGDAHEAFNFAAVWQAPVVFVIQNNQYAISVPVAKQSHARTLADKAIGYGMPGYYVDGNDVAAMYAVISAAVENARAGHGPTLIEGLTYRVEAHTNSDDPTRYREREEEGEWAALDPIARLERYLRDTGDLADELSAQIAAEAEALATHVREAVTAEVALDPLELFDHVYVNQRANLEEQREYLARELGLEPVLESELEPRPTTAGLTTPEPATRAPATREPTTPAQATTEPTTPEPTTAEQEAEQ